MGLNAWTTAGTVMLFYLAALQSISTDVYEAAAIDGTSTWRTLWRITFPLLKPAHFFVLVVFGIGALKIFDQSFIVSGGTGGPVYSTYTAVLYIYNEAFKSANFGVAASAGVVMFVAIFLLTLIQRATSAGRNAVMLQTSAPAARSRTSRLARARQSSARSSSTACSRPSPCSTSRRSSGRSRPR